MQLFRDTYVENAALYRAQQMKELDILARAIAVHHSGSFDNQKVADMWSTLEADNKGTL